MALRTMALLFVDEDDRVIGREKLHVVNDIVEENSTSMARNTTMDPKSHLPNLHLHTLHRHRRLY